MSMAGYFFASSAAYIQCVVARRPSSRPASANTNAPEQNDADARHDDRRREGRRAPPSPEARDGRSANRGR